MKKFALLPIGALAFAAACSDSPTAAVAPDAAMFNAGGVANTDNGPVWVNGEFTFELTTAGGTDNGAVPPGVNMHPQAGTKPGGSCRQADGTVDSADPRNNTVWYNSKGQQQTAAKFCQGKSGEASAVEVIIVTCTIHPLRATYAMGSGNKALNFDATQTAGFTEEMAADENLVPPDLFVHYRLKQNDTRGVGIAGIEYSCDNNVGRGSGTLNLTKFSKSPGSSFVPFREDGVVVGQALTLVSSALNVTLPSNGSNLALTELSWVYRSRVGS